MAWIGIECALEPGELMKWAAWLKGVGADNVAGFLMSAADLLSGKTVGASEIERMREIERRAADSVERKRADVAAKAAAVMGKAIGKGMRAEDVAAAIGLTGFQAGEAGGRNAGVARKRLAYTGKGSAVRGADGGAEVIAQKGKCPVGAAATVLRDRAYGESFEGWCLYELRKAGFKMGHAARGVEMTVTDAWRCVSGWERHWRRQGVRGRVFPGPASGWVERYKEASERAQGFGLRGKCVVLNGSGKGNGVDGFERNMTEGGVE